MIATAQQDVWHIGADLVKLREAGLSTPFLFDTYGIVTPDIPSRWTTEKRAYYLVAIDFFVSLRDKHLRSRSGTHFRVAGAILNELCTAEYCQHCGSTGIAHNRGECTHCHGTGFKLLSVWRRAEACDCHRTYFRKHLSRLYLHKLCALATSMRENVNSLSAPGACSQNRGHGKDLDN